MQTVLSKSATKAFVGRSAAPVRPSVAARAAAPETVGMSGLDCECPGNAQAVLSIVLATALAAATA